MCQPFNISPRISIRLTSCYYTDFFVYLLIYRQNFSSLPLALELGYCTKCCWTSAFLLQPLSGSRLFGCKQSGSNFPTSELQIHPVIWQHHLFFPTCKKQTNKTTPKPNENASIFCLKCICHFYLVRHLNYADNFYF